MACVLCTVQPYTLAQCTTHTPHRSHYAAIALITSARRSGVPRNYFRGGVQQIQLRTEDRENGDLGGGSPLVRGSGGSCSLVQEISFHIIKFSQFLVL